MTPMAVVHQSPQSSTVVLSACEYLQHASIVPGVTDQHDAADVAWGIAEVAEEAAERFDI